MKTSLNLSNKLTKTYDMLDIEKHNSIKLYHKDTLKVNSVVQLKA
jgi:hypothetical protein